MLRITQSSVAAQVKSYYTNALSKSDYYTKNSNDQELEGHFHGRLATRLSVAGPVTKGKFFALCENINPATGENLTLRNKEDRTIGYDMTFSCPKSVSIVHALSNDDHILKVFRASVTDVMKDIEADAMTRVRKLGQYEDRNTGELLFAEFTHQTSRPVDHQSPDPQLHSHCFVFNATWDKQEQQIKAGQFRDIVRDRPYYQARFYKNLSDRLIELGYQVKATDKAFEIEGVPKNVISLFSKRSQAIDQFAKENGISDPKALGELGARTRAKKQSGLSMEQLKQDWRKQIRENISYADGETDLPVRYHKDMELSKLTPDDHVNHALNHSFERASVVPDRRILATAYHHSIGNNSAGLNDITQSFKSDRRIIQVKDRYRNYCTTKEVLAEEKRMVQLARKGQGKFRPLYKMAPTIKLDGQQGAAIAHVLTTPHQVSIVMGAAGSGKTTLMTEAKQHINAAGLEIFVVAPTTQAKGVLVKEGFENAETVAMLLIDKKLQAQLKDQVLWVDEAGLLGTKDATALLQLAEKQNARLIYGGDTRQHSAILKGDALRILNTVGGIEAAEVNKIRRQTNVHYRAAVEDLARGDVKAAFIKLTSIGAIKNVDPLNPNKDLVTAYIKTIQSKKTALIVSPTHEQGRAITGEVRQHLKAFGMLGKKDLPAVRLSNKNYTEAEKTDWRNYAPGQIIQFNQHVPKIARGSVWKIEAVNKDQVIITSTDGKTCELPCERASAYDVFHSSEIALTKGDKIRITRNGYDQDGKRLNNGQLLEVASINKSGTLALKNPQSKSTFKLDKDFGHIDHAYCSTSHSSQGKTVDHVFVSQVASTFAATDKKQFYVSVSRGKEAVSIYTDDRKALLEYVSNAGDRQSALELVKDIPSHTDYVIQQERTQSMVPKPIEPAKENISPLLKYYDSYEPGI